MSRKRKISPKKYVKIQPLCKQWPLSLDLTECQLLFTTSLKVDYNYQRQIINAYVLKLMKIFDTNKFGFPVVSQRKNGTYFIIDGQQRIAAAIGLAYETIPAIILKGLTPRQEAAFFLALNDNKKVTPISRFKAKLFKGDPVSKIINTSAQNSGCKFFTKEGEQNKNQQVNCIATIEKLYTKYGKDHLCHTLKFLMDIWKGDKDAFLEPMVKGAAIFLDDPGIKNFNYSKAVEKFKRMPAISMSNEGTRLCGEFASFGYDRGKMQAKAFRKIYKKRK